MPTIPYTIQNSVYKRIGRHKYWAYEYEHILVDVNDKVAKFFASDEKESRRRHWRIKKQKQDAKIYTEISFDEMINSGEGSNEEYSVEEIIEDVFHPDNRDPFEIVFEKDAEIEREARIKELADRLDEISASILTKKQYEVWKYRRDGYRFAEMAEALGIDESSARERLRNALKRLKKHKSKPKKD